MYPHERSLVKQYADDPFVLLGVNSDSDREELKKILVEKDLTWRSWWNKSTEVPISEQWNVSGWPTIYLIDDLGRIRHKNMRGEALDKAIAELVAEAKAR